MRSHQIRRVIGLLGLALLPTSGCANPTNGPTPDQVPANAVRVTTEPIAEVQSLLTYSGIDQPARMVITNPTGWANVWGRLFGHTQPAPPVAPVDFARSAVVVAAMGNRPSGGHSITFEGAYRDDRRLYLVLLERAPGPACMTTAAITAPAVAVRIPRTDLSVVYVEKRETVHCE